MLDPKVEALYSLLIISKSGSLLYENDFSSAYRKANPLTADERLFLGSTFHALEALSSSEIGPSLQDLAAKGIQTAATATPQTRAPRLQVVSPNTSNTLATQSSQIPASFFSNLTTTGIIPPLGLQTIETSSFKLHCFQTLTGLKFVGVCSPNHNSIDTILRNIYLLYTDYALKNPFYITGMPIRCELFDEKLRHYIGTRQSIN